MASPTGVQAKSPKPRLENPLPCVKPIQCVVSVAESVSAFLHVNFTVTPLPFLAFFVVH